MSGGIDNGGAAFPEIVQRYNPDRDTEETVSEGGMTLRDYFAAKAMQAYLQIIHQNHASAGSEQGMDAIADAAYGLADAMLKARKS